MYSSLSNSSNKVVLMLFLSILGFSEKLIYFCYLFDSSFLRPFHRKFCNATAPLFRFVQSLFVRRNLHLCMIHYKACSHDVHYNCLSMSAKPAGNFCLRKKTSQVLLQSGRDLTNNKHYFSHYLNLFMQLIRSVLVFFLRNVFM